MNFISFVSNKRFSDSVLCFFGGMLAYFQGIYEFCIEDIYNNS